MMTHPVTQGSPAWHLLRAGRVTASALDALISPTWEVRTGKMPQTYLCELLAEHILGKPLEDGQSWAMGQGQILEDEARAWLEFTEGVKVTPMGYCSTDDMKCGCSPDGLIGEDGGLELKCPQPQTHVKYLLAGTLPPEYAAQVHGSLYVTGRKWWRFMSYCRGFPPLSVLVLRDEAIQAKIHEAVTGFLARFDLALKQIESLQAK